MTEAPGRRSPLHDVHLAAGARMVDFGGWEMPLCYQAGTVAEHLACRNASAMFDVSHLGTVRVSGAGAHRALQKAFTNDLNRIGPGTAQYTHLLDSADGSVVDDIIVWQTGADRFDVMPNASNTDRVLAALTAGTADALGGEPGNGSGSEPSAAGRDDLVVKDVTSTRALIAVQGPQARARLAEALPQAAEAGRFRVAEISFGDVPVTVAGTGYTGEDGVELAVPAEHASALWDALAAVGVPPAGLGSRDTLRLEAGLPLYGHELGPGITPFQAGLGWVARFDKGEFRGRAALEAERVAGPRRLLRGLLGETRRPPRSGCTVRRGAADIGVVTSGNFSPVLGRGIALAFLTPDVKFGERVTIDIRGRGLAATVVKPPFHRLLL